MNWCVSGIPSTSHVQPVSDVTESAVSKDLSPSQTRDEQRPRTRGADAATVGSKLPLSSPTQSASPHSQSQKTEVDNDLTSRQLDQIDSTSFSQSAKSLRLTFPPDMPGLAAMKDMTSARSSPLVVTSSPKSLQTQPSPLTVRQVLKDSANSPGLKSPPDSPGLAATKNMTSARSSSLVVTSLPKSLQTEPSPLSAGQVLKDSANAPVTKSPTENRLSLVTSSSAGGSPFSADNSQGNSAGSGRGQVDSASSRDSVGTSQQQLSPLTAPVSYVDSPLSTSSAPGRISAYVASMKLAQSPDPAPATLSEKSIGRGMKLLALLKGHNTAVEVGASASHSAQELTSTECQNSDEFCGRVTRDSRKLPSTNVEEMPRQILLSAGLDEDIESRVEPVEQPHPSGGRHQFLRQLIAEKQTSPKSSDHRLSMEEPVSPCGGNVNNAPSVVDLDVSPTNAKTKPSMQSTPSPVVVPQETSFDQLPDDQATQNILSQNDQTERGHTPVSCDSPGPLERSLGSSTDVSLCSDGPDRSSSSKMLTKRLPRIASSRSSSRTGTPVPPPTLKSLPDPDPQLCGPRSTQSTPLSSSPRHALGRNESYDCIPENRSEPAIHPTVPATDRYCMIIPWYLAW